MFYDYEKPKFSVFKFDFDDVIKTSIVCPTDGCPTDVCPTNFICIDDSSE